jgi:YVTN family beta-propeller protein
VVNVSGIIEVIDLKTAKTVSQIRLVNDEGKNREPRYIDFLEGKAYVCSFDGTVSRIDTSTLNIERTIRVGKNPDGICHANGKIYVSNSGGLNFPAYDNSVSVIDVRSFAVLHTLEVGTNPYHIEADDEGDVYVVVRGNYSNDSSRLVKIDGKDETIITFGNVAATDLVILNDTAYIYHFDNSTNQFSIKTFDCKSDKIITDNFITDNTLPSTPNGLDINPANGDIYLTDAKTYTVLGDVLCYNNQGKLKFRLQEAGLNPRKVIFL